MKARLFAGATLAAILGLTPAVCASEQETILGNVAASSNHTILLSGLRESGLASSLDVTPGKMTLFAPTDEAFKKLGVEQIKKLVADKELLRKIMLAHVVPDTALTADDLSKRKELNGFRVSTKDGLKIGDAKVVVPNLKCSNGIIHTIDTVLIPAK